MRQRRAALSPELARAASAAIQAAVLAMPGFRLARTVACYMAAPGEVQTAAILGRCRESGKQVVVPSWSRRAGGYVFARIGKKSVLRPGPLGILQPGRAAGTEPATIDLAIVPGLAFDTAGNRLGHGGGHYDRLLARACARGAYKTGLAFDCQVVGAVPAGRTDVRMDAVVTESGLKVCGSRNATGAMSRRRQDT